MLYAILGWCFGYFIGWGSGWKSAHISIAKECERLGGFFVKNKTFKCTEIKDELQ